MHSMEAILLPMVLAVCLTHCVSEPLKMTCTFPCAIMKDVFSWSCRHRNKGTSNAFRSRSQSQLCLMGRRMYLNGWNSIKPSQQKTAIIPEFSTMRDILSFTVSKKNRLYFPLTVTIPDVGKVAIEHAGPRPAHVKDRPFASNTEHVLELLIAFGLIPGTSASSR